LARHRDAVCRLCRREGQKLFLKGLRCFTEKCAIEKRNFVPGQHGQSLERRLDNVVWRAGLASSRAQARQLVLHGHVRINGKKVNIPSYLINVGEEVAIKDKMHQNAMVLEARNVAQSQSSVPWLEQDREQFKAKVVALPKREDVQTPPINEQLIVELYSK